MPIEERNRVSVARDTRPPGRLTTVSLVRSTLIITSIELQRRAGTYDAYRAGLEEGRRDDLASLVAGTWIPIELALAHYRALDRLELPGSDVLQLGYESGVRARSGWIGTAARLAKVAGATPWTIFDQFPALWARSYVGGAMTVERAGPKEAMILVARLPLHESPYFRHATIGFYRAAVELFCQRLYVREVPMPSFPWSMTLRFQWA